MRGQPLSAGLGLIAAACALVAMHPAPVDAKLSRTFRSCGSVTVIVGHDDATGDDYEGAAAKIRSRGPSCAKARRVAKACVLGRSTGWVVSQVGDGGIGSRIHMDRGSYQTITFSLAGGGGCFP